MDAVGWEVEVRFVGQGRAREEGGWDGEGRTVVVEGEGSAFGSVKEERSAVGLRCRLEAAIELEQGAINAGRV